MKKITQEEFDRRIEASVQMITEKYERLLKLIDQRPDLYSSDKHEKVFRFLQASHDGCRMIAANFVAINVSRNTPFSLDAPVITNGPPIPSAVGGRLSRHAPDYSNGQPKIEDEIDGVDFIEE